MLLRSDRSSTRLTHYEPMLRTQPRQVGEGLPEAAGSPLGRKRVGAPAKINEFGVFHEEAVGAAVGERDEAAGPMFSFDRPPQEATRPGHPGGDHVGAHAQA